MNNYIQVTFIIEKEGDQYSALCQELGTVSCGDSVEEATKNLEEAVTLYLETIEELGQRPRIFEECGIAVRNLPPRPSRDPVDFPSFSSYATRHAIPVGC